MAKLDADMQSLVRRTILCFAATINGDGSPNLSPKSTLIVHDEHHLLFANIASPRTVANLRLDPRIEINCVDIFSRRGFRFTGHASVRSAGDPIYNEFAAAEHGRCHPDPRCRACQGAFCQTNSFTRLRYVAGVTETNLREVYARKSGWRRSRPRKARNDPDSNGIRQGGSGRSPSNVRSKLLLRRLQYSPVVAPTGRVRVSQINGCSYCIWLHSRQIKELGETGERLAAIEHWRAALCLSDAERAALEWAEFVTRIADGAPPDAAFAALRHHFDDRQIVDLTAIIANMNSLNRMAISFQLEAPPSQVTDKI